MKFPKSIKILGKTWEVEWCKHIAADEENYGAVHWAGQKIRLQDDLPFDQCEETLLHELMHIIDINAALDMTEEEVRRLGNNIHQIIADNPCLFCGCPLGERKECFPDDDDEDEEDEDQHNVVSEGHTDWHGVSQYKRAFFNKEDAV